MSDKSSRIKDLTGLRFGKLTVISMSGKIGKKVAWKCKCDCGKETIATGTHLKTGHTRSCGCIAKETYDEKIRDLTGQKFGRWTVLSLEKNLKSRRSNMEMSL